VFGEPTPVLLEASDEADMVVVGNQSGDCFANPQTASVSVRLAGRASCVAFDQAARRGCALRTVGHRAHRPALLPDSVGLQLIHHADCPVLVARTDTAQDLMNGGQR
jgi:nucleotide-binding universal stress UspA family protein